MVIIQILCSSNLNESIILSDLRKFKVGIAFVNEVEEGVNVGDFSSSPLHH